MKHHIREINDLLMKDKIQQAKDYLHQISDEIINAQNIYNTGNEAFDGILNFYAEKYMNKSLELAVSVAIPENLEINIYDVNIILGNLLDNAIEAAADSKDKYIILHILKKESSVFFIIYNTFREKPDLEKIFEKGYTTKGDEHGNGLYFVKEYLEKRDDIYPIFSIERNEFVQSLEIVGKE